MVLGHAVWQERFGGDPAIVGRTIRMGTIARQVVGVAAPGFRFPANSRTEAMVPMRVPAQAPADRKNGWVFAVGRLEPGATLERAAAELSAISRQMEQEFPADNQGSRYFGLTIRDAMVGDSKRALLLLFAAVSLVMLIACVNVANLLWRARSGGARRWRSASRSAPDAGGSSRSR